MLIKTMAAEITEESYSLAVACLPAGFAAHSFEEVKGHYVVINELSPRFFKKLGERPILTIDNSWMQPSAFTASYRFVDPPTRGVFMEVTKR